MNETGKKQVDEIGVKILRELQLNARATFSEIAAKVGLSSPAVAERIYKMEEAGIIKGYHADIDPEVLGHNITAFITLTTAQGMYKGVHRLVENQKEILECHHVSGRESFIIKAVSGSISQLDTLLESLGRLGETQTSIVLSSPVKKKTPQPI